MKHMPDLIGPWFAQHISVAQRVQNELAGQIQTVGEILIKSFAAGGKMITCGNGGSAADSQHFAEEMIGRFLRTRRAVPAISLTSDGTAMTCIANDFGYPEVFSRQVQALAKPGDVVVGFSTSGNSENVLRAMHAAKQNLATTVAMLGNTGGKIAPVAQHSIIVPSNITAHIQEMHIVIVHILCDMVDRWAAGEVG
jgi:D-sedoheptulose 7-phosphate isomerase